MCTWYVKESRKRAINEVTLGATPDQGGTRGKTVTIGGETSLTYLTFEGEFPRRPAIAVEVFDIAPEDWPPQLAEHYKDVFGDTAAWA
ncbi:MAG: acetyl-CoA decarbonylase/synthase complex subunit delta, partial [Sulfurovum sp.]